MALSFTPGQVISWDDLNAMLAQHGSPQGAKSIREVKPKPLTEAEQLAIIAAGGDPNAARPVAYQYFMEDGSSFTAELDQAGEQTGDPVAGSGRGSTFRIVDYKPSQTYVAAQRQQASSETAPKEGDTRGPQTGRKREVWRSGQWVTEDNPLYEAKPGEDPEKPRSQTVTGGDGKPYVVTQAPGQNGGPPTVTVTDGAGNPVPGNAVPGKPDATKTPTTSSATEPLKGQPGWRVGKRASRDANGNETSETFYIDPQGNETLTPPDEGKKYAQVRQDEQTGQWFGLTPQGQWEPMQGGPGAGSGVALPPGMARPQFTAGEVTNALVETREKLDAWVAEGATDAERASRNAEAVNAMKEAHQLATTYLTEQAQIQGTARDVFGTQVSQRGQDASMINQRTSAGASMANQAVSSFVPMLRYAQAGSGDPVAAFQALMGLMRGNVEQMGGLVDLPRVGVPSAIPQSAQGQMQPSQTGTNVVGGAPSGLPPIVRGAAQQSQPAPGVTIQVNAPTPEQAAAPVPFAGQQSYDPNQWDRGPDGTLVPREFTPGGNTLPPPAVMQKVFDMVEPLMAQDPNWGVDDLGLIQQGVGPLG